MAGTLHNKLFIAFGGLVRSHARVATSKSSNDGTKRRREK